MQKNKKDFMIDELLMVPISDEMIEIINNLKKRDWIVSNFYENPDLYFPNLYIENKLSHKTKFKFLLDRNILNYVLSGIKGSKSSLVRDAIGLVAFCQLSEIELDISLGIHEIFHDRFDMKQAHSEIERFLQIDDSNQKELEKFATKKTDKFETNNKEIITAKQQISNWYTKYNTETNFCMEHLISDTQSTLTSHPYIELRPQYFR